jgi:hypothetical protein
MKNKKRKKKSKSKAPPASRNKLENVRREEQERLTPSEDKLYKVRESRQLLLDGKAS